MTTHQIADLHFASPNRARHRLLELHRRRVLNRFQPQVARGEGSAPWHYVMDVLGAHVIAAQLGLEIKALKARIDRDVNLWKSPRLRHMLEVNDFFVSMAVACEEMCGYELAEWWGEATCQQRWMGSYHEPIVTPDGEGLLAGPGSSCSFFVELDRGTERGDRLAEKVVRYSRIAMWDKSPHALIFLFPSAAREAHARSSMSRFAEGFQTMALVTAHRALYERAPLGSAYLPMNANRRLRLSELPSLRRTNLS